MTFECPIPMGGITVLLSYRGHHSYYRFVNSIPGVVHCTTCATTVSGKGPASGVWYAYLLSQKNTEQAVKGAYASFSTPDVSKQTWAFFESA